MPIKFYSQRSYTRLSSTKEAGLGDVRDLNFSIQTIEYLRKRLKENIFSYESTKPI